MQAKEFSDKSYLQPTDFISTKGASHLFELPIPTMSKWGVVESATRLASGANNDILLVHFASLALVLKSTRKNGINRLKLEGDILRALHGCHAPALACPPLSQAGDIGFLWMDWIKGRHLNVLDLANASHLGKALRHIHGLEVNPLASQLDAPTCEEYFDNRLLPQFEFAKSYTPKNLCDSMERVLESIRKHVVKLGPSLVSRRRVLIHSDLIPLNILFDDQGSTLIDWELGRLDFPEWDIASINKSFQFTDGARAAFESSYANPIDRTLLDLVSLLHYSNVVLWRLGSFYGRGENQDIEVKFLTELNDELTWIQSRLSSPTPIY